MKNISKYITYQEATAKGFTSFVEPSKRNGEWQWHVPEVTLQQYTVAELEVLYLQVYGL